MNLSPEMTARMVAYYQITDEQLARYCDEDLRFMELECTGRLAPPLRLVTVDGEFVV